MNDNINTTTNKNYKLTKIGYIPKEWEAKPINQLTDRIKKSVDVETEKYYREIGVRSHGKGIFYKKKILGEKLGNKRVFWIEPDCFVVNVVFAWEQAVAKTTENEIGMIASHRFPMYKPKSEVLDLDYLLYFFKTPFGKHLLGLASPGGAGRNKTLGQNGFGKTLIPTPDYIEQVKISQIIKTWDTAIHHTQQLIQAKQNQKRGLMQRLLTGKVRLKGFEEEWKENHIDNLGKSYNGLSGKSKEDFGEGSPYIPYVNIFNNSKINILNFNYVKINKNDKQTEVQYGDLLFTVSSETSKEAGMSSVYLDNMKGIYLNSFCFGFRLHTFDILLPEFARFFFRSPAMRKKISSLAQGSTRFNLSKNQFKKITVHLPSIEEQKAIAAILSTADEELRLLEAQLSALQAQKKGLMQQLLTGKIRVKV